MMTKGVVVVLLVAVVAVQSTPLALRKFSSEDCGDLVAGCFAPAIQRYIDKDETEVYEEIRNTPLRTHCSDWNTAIGCFRQVINSDACSDLKKEEEDFELLEGYLRYFDWYSNYICVEHFDKVDRNFRCLVTPEVSVSIITTCAERVDNLQDPCTLIRQKSEILQCTSEAVTSKCGSEAATVVRDLNVKGYEMLEKYVKDRCPTLDRARQLAKLKEFLLRL